MRPPGEIVQTGAQGRRTGRLWLKLSQLWTAVHFSRPPRRLRVVETLQLGEKRQLLVVSVDDRKLLVGAAANFLGTLAELPAEAAKNDAKEPETERE